MQFLQVALQRSLLDGEAGSRDPIEQIGRTDGIFLRSGQQVQNAHHSSRDTAWRFAL
ncbi:hypothetical protein D3C78_1320460 [compost metagenome]